jgi:endoglucanase
LGKALSNSRFFVTAAGARAYIRNMRYLLILFCAAFSVRAAQPDLAAKGFEAKDAHAQVREMRRGVNVLGYDPFWRDEGKARFKEAHFKRIREGGFQTIRVNLHAFRRMDAENKLEPAWLKKLDWVVEHGLAAGLVVILDEHDFQAVAADAEKGKTRLLAFWEAISKRYKNKSNSLLFEILNEPNGQFTADVWNTFLLEALSVIRGSNPERNVIIGPASWNSIRELDKLKLPEKDRHIIVTVHYYLPMQFTHQGAPWTPSTAQLSGITWGTEQDKAKVKADFEGVQKWAKANDRPIFLGEFGAYDKGDIDSRVAYTRTVARTAEASGWAWAYWQFDGDFIVFDMKKDDWNTPIHDALVK